MPTLTNISAIKGILQKHGFQFSGKLGQNFLINPSVCPRMAAHAVTNDHTAVIEVGPGIGVLTVELAKVAKKVVAIELDERLLPILDETLAGLENVEVIHGDVMKVDLAALVAEKFEGLDVVVCANLPYYITSPVIMRFLEEKPGIKSLTVMVQKEAADRITASPKTRECGAISFAVSYHSRPAKLFDLSPGSFMPAPSVTSTVIKLDILPEPPVKADDEAFFFDCVKAGFSMRRKTLLNCLSAYFRREKAEIKNFIAEAGLKETARIEELSLEELCKLSNIMLRTVKKA